MLLTIPLHFAPAEKARLVLYPDGSETATQVSSGEDASAGLTSELSDSDALVLTRSLERDPKFAESL